MLPLDSPRRTRADLKSSKLGLKLFALGPGQFSAKMNGIACKWPFDPGSARSRSFEIFSETSSHFARPVPGSVFYESDVTDKVKQGIMGARNNVLFTVRSAVHV